MGDMPEVSRLIFLYYASKVRTDRTEKILILLTKHFG